MHQLEGPRRKLNWATKHLAQLDGEITKYRNKEPYIVVPVTHPDTGNPAFKFIDNHIPIPDELALTACDYIHNARATLDHIFWQLIDICGNRAPDHLTFPIWIDPPSKKKLKNTFELVTSDVARAIEGVQPYSVAEKKGRELDAFALMHRLDIVDKHQTVAVVSEGVMITFVTPTGPMAGLLEGLSDGEVFELSASVSVPSSNFDPKPEVQPSFGIGFETADRQPRILPLWPINQMQSINNEIERRVFGGLSRFFEHD